MKEATETKCGLDISEGGIERILIASKSDADAASTFRLLARIAPELRQLDLALRGQMTGGKRQNV